MSDIDLFQYGQLVSTVEAMEKKMDKMEKSMDELLALANKGRGGFWAGMAIISAISSLIGFVAHYLSLK
jgi:hypothetical protein